MALSRVQTNGSLSPNLALLLVLYMFPRNNFKPKGDRQPQAKGLVSMICVGDVGRPWKALPTTFVLPGPRCMGAGRSVLNSLWKACSREAWKMTGQSLPCTRLKITVPDLPIQKGNRCLIYCHNWFVFSLAFTSSCFSC